MYNAIALKSTRRLTEERSPIDSSVVSSMRMLSISEKSPSNFECASQSICSTTSGSTTSSSMSTMSGGTWGSGLSRAKSYKTDLSSLIESQRQTMPNDRFRSSSSQHSGPGVWGYFVDTVTPS